jgi:hypothetical protein
MSVDREFLLGAQFDKFRILEENERVINAGGRPASAPPLDPGRHRLLVVSARGDSAGCLPRRGCQRRREPPPPPPIIQPSDEDMELDREMEYLAEPDEALDRGADEGI